MAAVVQMGEPELNAKKIPSTLNGLQIVNHSFQFQELQLNGTLVSMGNPHFITFVEDVQSVPVDSDSGGNASPFNQ
jgi:diaminopimelate epimerase